MHEILTLEDVGFQLQQKEILSPRRRLSTIEMFPIPWMDFHVSLNLNAHSTFRFGKSVLRNLAAPMIDHKNKWESVGLMDGCYVVGITAWGCTPSYTLHTHAFRTYLLGGLFTLQKILQGDGITHVKNLKYYM